MDDFDKFYNSSLRFLSYRPRSEKEVRDYLVRHSGDSERSPAPDGAGRSVEDSRIKNGFWTSSSALSSLPKGQNDDKESIIEKTIVKLKEQKFINDEEFAKWWIESRLRFRPRSINLIKRELLQKGVDKELIDGQISNLIHSTGSGQISNELENAKKLIEKKIERYKNLSKQEIYQKLSGFLARRGFDWETIKQSIDEVILKEYN